MNIQYIVCGNEISIANLTDLGAVTTRLLRNPMGFEQFDLNIIDLGADAFWVCDELNSRKPKDFRDLITLKEMISSSREDLILIIAPLNISFSYGLSRDKHGRGYYKNSTALKNIIQTLNSCIDAITVLEGNSLNYSTYTYPTLNEGAQSDFYLESRFLWEGIHTAPGSDKFVFARKNGTRTYLTTINHLDVKGLITLLEMADETLICATEVPEWLEDVHILDDIAQLGIVEECFEQIEMLKTRILDAESVLKKNNWYKSILYEAEANLEEVVTEILEIILSIDLNEFVDEGNEDLRLTVNDIVYLIEIKGTSQGVRRDHLAQLDNHVQTYLEENDDLSKTVKGLLIINPQRNLALQDRSPVHDDQIKLAQRNDSLIIETSTLLRMLEVKIEEEKSSEDMADLLNQTGLLKID